MVANNATEVFRLAVEITAAAVVLGYWESTAKIPYVALWRTQEFFKDTKLTTQQSCSHIYRLRESAFAFFTLSGTYLMGNFICSSFVRS